jgi:hypothetical protein
MLLSRRLRTFAVAAAIGGLLLNAATPMLANAAAAIRGVPTGEICDLYGVRMPSHDVPVGTHEMPVGAHDMPVGAHAMHADMPASHDGDAIDDAESADAGMAMEDGAMDHGDADVAPDPVVAPPPVPHHHDDSSALHHGNHCALTALATFAPPVDALTTAIIPPVQVDGEALRVTRAAIFDAAAYWTIRLKRGPPAIA